MPIVRIVPASGPVDVIPHNFTFRNELPFVVGAPPQWDDNSDASYADLETFASNSGSVADTAVATLGFNSSVRVAPDETLVVARVRFQTMGTGMHAPDVGVSAGSTQLLTSGDLSSISSGLDAAWVEAPLTQTAPGNLGVFLDAARNGTATLTANVIAPRITTAPTRFLRTRIIEFELRVITVGGIAPPCRLTGRGDSLDFGGGRVAPTHKTQQGGRPSGTY